MNRLLAWLLVAGVLVAGCKQSAVDGKKTGVGGAQTQPAGEDQSAEVSRLVNERDEIVSILKNGMVVIAKRVPTPAVSIRGYVKAGGIYEAQWLGGGLSHLLEHLVAGGTNDRRTEEQNRNLLQEIGNVSNAGTYPDRTVYYVNTTPDNLDKGVDLIAGWMLGAKITPDEYRREYEVVQRELEKDEGEPDWVFYHQTNRNRYLLSPARVPTIGYQEVIQGLSRDDVYAYYKLAYVPNNMTFSIAGNVEPERMLEAVQKNVRNAVPGRAFSHDIADEPPVHAPRTLVSTFPKLGQAKLDLGFPTVRLGHPDMYPLDLLATVLGTGESALLVQELRDKRQLVSAVGASDFTPQYVDGTFSVTMELDPAKVAEATSAVLEILEKIKTDGISEDRLARAKTQTKTMRAFAQQTSEDVADSLATDWITTGDPHFSDRYVERMEKVTVEQIKEVATRYFDRNKLLTTAMLPEEAVGEGGLARAEAMLRAAAPTTLPATQPSAPGAITRVELADGTILLLKRVNTAPIVTMSLYSLGGLTAEDAKTNGLGNLAMQLAPRGTRTRSAQQIAEFFDSVGGRLTTTSGNNSWNWTATCLKDDFGKTFEVFADVVKNPTFPENETANMKKRILASIEAQDADWFGASMRYFRKSYFEPAKSPYQFMPTGQKETVQSFTAGQAKDWYANKVLKSRRVLAVFGDIDVAEARMSIAQQFGGESAPRRPARESVSGITKTGSGRIPDVPMVNVSRVHVNKSPNPQAGVVIGFDARVVVGEPQIYAMNVADTLVSGYGYPTGYIFEILRGRGLIYDSHAYLFPGRSSELPGTFLIYAGCDPKNVNEVTDVILENMARLYGKPEEINVDWFNRAKNLAITTDALQNETAAAQAQTAALDELFGLGYNHHDQFPQRIRAVTLQDVRQLARDRLSDCVVTITTSEPEAVKVKEGLRSYQSFPPVDLTPKGVEHDSK